MTWGKELLSELTKGLILLKLFVWSFIAPKIERWTTSYVTWFYVSSMWTNWNIKRTTFQTNCCRRIWKQYHLMEPTPWLRMREYTNWDLSFAMFYNVHCSSMSVLYMKRLLWVEFSHCNLTPCDSREQPSSEQSSWPSPSGCELQLELCLAELSLMIII